MLMTEVETVGTNAQGGSVTAGNKAPAGQTKQHVVKRSLIFPDGRTGSDGACDTSWDVFKRMQPSVVTTMETCNPVLSIPAADPVLEGLDGRGAGQLRGEASVSTGCRANAATVSPAGKPRVGIITTSRNIELALEHLLQKSGCEVIRMTAAMMPRIADLARLGVHTAIVEGSGNFALETVRQVRSVAGEDSMRVIVVTDTPDEAGMARAEGAAEAFAKPLDLKAIVGVARKLATENEREAPLVHEPSGHDSVLVVSDHVSQLIALGSALSKQGGHQVWLARGRADALQQAEERRPAVVLVDLRMDKREARTLIELLARQHRVPKMVFITEQGKGCQREAISKSGVAAVIESPVNLLALAENVRKATGIRPTKNGSNHTETFRGEMLRVLA